MLSVFKNSADASKEADTEDKSPEKILAVDDATPVAEIWPDLGMTDTCIDNNGKCYFANLKVPDRFCMNFVGRSRQVE